jgi:hypothetical protein
MRPRKWLSRKTVIFHSLQSLKSSLQTSFDASYGDIYVLRTLLKSKFEEEKDRHNNAKSELESVQKKTSKEEKNNTKYQERLEGQTDEVGLLQMELKDAMGSMESEEPTNQKEQMEKKKLDIYFSCIAH